MANLKIALVSVYIHLFLKYCIVILYIAVYIAMEKKEIIKKNIFRFYIVLFKGICLGKMIIFVSTKNISTTAKNEHKKKNRKMLCSFSTLLKT